MDEYAKVMMLIGVYRGVSVELLRMGAMIGEMVAAASGGFTPERRAAIRRELDETFKTHDAQAAAVKKRLAAAAAAGENAPPVPDGEGG